jgi:putative salt-induced outer membrane protein
LAASHRRLLSTALVAASAAGAALADDAPAPPQNTWIGKGQVGFLDSRGNSNSESVNGNIDVWRFDGPWKNDIYLAALYGKNNGIVSAERWEAREQTNYTFAGNLFAFGGLRFEHDLFDGFSVSSERHRRLGLQIHRLAVHHIERAGRRGLSEVAARDHHLCGER